MSNLDNLIQKILDDAKNKADEILQEADKIKKEILNEKLNKAEAEKVKILDKAKKDSALIKNQIISNAKLKARDDILAAKQSIIDKVFDAAKEQLINISDEQYIEFLKNTISAFDLKGNEIIVVPENRKELVKSLMLNLLISDNETINSGFVIIDGNIRINYTFNALLETLRDNLETEIAKELFKTED